MKSARWSQILITAGFTAILVGYFLVWLPQPVAGLSFIGLDLGEWVKFIPQVRSGEINANRNLFYLPPITLSTMMIAWTATWIDRRWQTWVVRLLAVAIAFLAFPSVEAIKDELPSEWLIRVLLVTLVFLLALLSPLLKRFSGNVLIKGSWIVILLLGLMGALLPTWTYLAIIGPVEQLLQSEVGIGPGVLLNIAGHLILAGTAAYSLASGPDASSQHETISL